MLKLLGIVAIITGSGGCAFSIVRERRAYLERCGMWREIFQLMENEIAYQKSSLPEICERAGAHLSGSRKLFLERIGSALGAGQGDTLGEVWRREAKKIFREEPLRAEIEKEVEELGAKLCFEDGDMQRKMLRDTEKYIEKHQNEQESQNREKNKLTLCAGLMGGLLLTVLLL